MNTSEKTYTVEGMTCGHCELSVREEVEELTAVDEDAVPAAVETWLRLRGFSARAVHRRPGAGGGRPGAGGLCVPGDRRRLVGNS